MSLQVESKILAVDVCGTLFRANTTAGFIIHHHSKNKNFLRFFFMLLITGRYQPLRYLLILIAKLTGYDIHRTLSVLTLRAEPRQSLKASAKSYVSVLQRLKIPSTHKLIAEMVHQGWQAILVSNSIDLVICAIAEEMELQFVASQLAWINDKSAGKISTDITGQKRAHLEKFLKFPLKNIGFAVITDNKSDGDLISIASPAFLVTSGDSKGWMKGYNAQIINDAG